MNKFDLISNHIKPTHCLDIGANVGGWYKEAKAAWPKCEFFLIEGNPACGEMLETAEVAYMIALLSDKHKEVDFWTQPGAPTGTGASIYKENSPFYNGAKPTKALTYTLDSIFKEFLAFDLIKLDVQGSELDILKGGPIVLAEAKAVLMEVALTNYNEGAPQAAEVISFMADKGFPVAIEIEKVHDPFKNHVQTDILFLR